MPPRNQDAIGWLRRVGVDCQCLWLRIFSPCSDFLARPVQGDFCGFAVIITTSDQRDAFDRGDCSVGAIRPVPQSEMLTDRAMRADFFEDVSPEKMKSYRWFLFDADDTLFHFDAFHGLRRMFSRYEVMFADADFREYQALNKPLWVAYQNGRISAEDLQRRRFLMWAERLQVSAHELNSAYLTAMAEICTPLIGAVSLLNALRGVACMGIITNGFTALQQARLARTGLADHFEVLVISEEVGVAKPDRRIFDHALALMGNPPRDLVLMVGDNLDTDIQGGINAGLDTCWVNADGAVASATTVPTHEVESLAELERFWHAR